MPTHVDTDAVKRSAREILDKRVDAALRIAQGHQERLDKQEAAAAAERDYAALWAAGLREGWTEAELKAMDLIPPGRKAAGRPTRPRGGRAASANGAGAPTPAAAAGGGDTGGSEGGE